MKLGSTLYVKNSIEAVEIYKEAFGLTLGYNEKFPDGTFLHAALLKNNDELFAVSESKNNDFLVNILLKSTMEQSRPTISLGIDFDNEEDIKKAYELLSKNGNVIYPLSPLPWSPLAADVVDKFGVYWYISIKKNEKY